jgi:hypothetical protein
MRKHAVALIVQALAWSSSAPALAFTWPLVGFSGAGATGTINPVTNLSGSTFCLAGVCGSDVSQDWLVFTVTLTAGYLDEIGVSRGLPAVSIPGMGEYDLDPGQAAQSGSLATSTLALFLYDPGFLTAANLEAGETTQRLFAAFTLGDLPGPGQVSPFPVPPGTINFMSARVRTSRPPASPVLVPSRRRCCCSAAGSSASAWQGQR